ncbi:NADP-dependent isocitrate dehydrogenase [Enterococcus gallinarum]|uniref:NADP-dependent isocitrate dehydrogenase n=1 Tax=Enterococcus gallinarum TaxID=1353 RepID=UPI001AD6A53A|nr:NADP-dependent isocitrate dehydrogenase [Enterococcus gallinarum]MBO6330215.1 NADP-dependent isocitrate dehydrogenase [Enterococcus gallinarum]MBO6352683.1 NADP-dependent isocitrate dehydrogenase [Enterococcus gallinarum]MBO6394681.1 NADP-dependent isocitrate dehydrogenase [Enterococcus gallinarum]MBO6424603.1 NADP-dependent isocitrate dehydrogenase [Enterococcus gallinarum]MDV7742453.1 NADP-dependent isocitrate dehydrogenase [Enterococcus gallinarum]
MHSEASLSNTVLTIPYISGDGIGPEIWQAAQPVIDAAVQQAYGPKRRIHWQEVLAGEKAFRQTGEWLPQSTLTTIQEAKIALKGPLTTPVGKGFRSLNVTLRQTLDLYACVRPVRYFAGVPSPLKHPEKTNMVIFRENTEDVYAGIEFAKNDPLTKQLIEVLQTQFSVKNIRFPESSAIGIKPISKEGSQRLISGAIEYAIAHHLPSVTLVHKGNIMKFTEGGFKNWGYQLAETNYADQCFTMNQWATIKSEQNIEAAQAALAAAQQAGKVIINDVIADNFLQQILLYPEKFSVIATCNLNGDYLSDALAAQVGGIGIAPGANINYVSGAAIFEATHGTAPDIVDTGKANPCSLLLSACMLLEYIQWDEAAVLITTAIETAIKEKKVTTDFAAAMTDAHCLSTKAFGDYLVTLITP